MTPNEEPTTEAGRRLAEGLADCACGHPTATRRILAIESEARATPTPSLREALVLGSLDEDDVMYDYPVAQSGEPMDPVLFVRWDAIRATATPGLDVERLARALLAVTIDHPGLLSDVDMLNDPLEGNPRPAAEAIAASYAALHPDKDSSR